MLFLSRLASPSIIVQGHDIEGVECSDRETFDRSSWPPGRSVRGGLESGRTKGRQWRERQGNPYLETLMYIPVHIHSLRLKSTTPLAELHGYCIQVLSL